MSDEERKEELVQANFILFKNFLFDFVTRKFSVCQNFKDDFIACKSENEIVKVFVKYSDDVYEKLGGSADDLEDEVADLENDISSLKWEINDLESQIETLTYRFKGNNGTLFSDYKTEIISQYVNNFNPWEIEELLKNGKKYLAINDILK